MAKKKYLLFWYNKKIAKTGEVYYITTSKERAVELFYKNYNKDYNIINIVD